ncbi:GTPase RsgA [Shigella flexneri]
MHLRPGVARLSSVISSPAKHRSVQLLLVLSKIHLLDSPRHGVCQRADGYPPNIGYTVLMAPTIPRTGLESRWESRVMTRISTSSPGSLAWVNQPVDNALLGLNDDLFSTIMFPMLGLGQHTTTAARLYHFLHGCDVIDSPGCANLACGTLSRNKLPMVLSIYEIPRTLKRSRKPKHDTHQAWRHRAAV